GPMPSTLAFLTARRFVGVSSMSWVSAASPSSSTVVQSPCSAPQVSTSVPSTATDEEVRNLAGIDAAMIRFANHPASTPTPSPPHARLQQRRQRGQDARIVNDLSGNLQIGLPGGPAPARIRQGQGVQLPHSLGAAVATG